MLNQANREYRLSGQQRYYVLFGVFVVLLAFAALGRARNHLPQGCDEFGYLHLADAIAEGKTFGSHTHRPFERDLVDYLGRSACPFRTYQYLVAPHAHHVDPHTHKIINQYPPGTSLLLSAAPQSLRRYAFAVLCPLLALAFLSGAFWYLDNPSKTANLCVLLAVLFLLVILPTFSDSLKQINSYAPTFGALIAAGVVLRRNGYLALLLLGFACAFRPQNALLAAPLMGVIWLHQSSLHPTRLVSWFAKGLCGAFCFLAGGVWIYFLYAWLLLGSPFRPTYSAVDLKTSFLAQLLDHVQFYLSPFNEWFWVHLVALAGIGWLTWKRDRRWLGWALAIAGCNYGFYLFHNVKIDYYPYASAMVLVGMFAGLLVENPDYIRWLERSPKWRLATFLVPCCVLLIAALTSLPRTGSLTDEAGEVAKYRRAFQPYDVVWAEFRSGTVEYTADVPAFRYPFGDPTSRRKVARWMHQQGYRQAFWIDDRLDLDQVKGTLADESIPYRQVVDPHFGLLLVTQPPVRTAGRASRRR